MGTVREVTAMKVIKLHAPLRSVSFSMWIVSVAGTVESQPPSAPAASDSSGNQMSGSIIFGIVLGVIGFLGIAVLIAYEIWKCRRIAMHNRTARVVPESQPGAQTNR